MNTIALADVAAVAASSGQSPTPAQPSAAQVAHFERQLQAPAQFYQAPTADTVGASGNWRVMVDGVAQIDQQYRIDSAALDKLGDMKLEENVSPTSAEQRGGGGPSSTTELHMRELSMAVHMGYTSMTISLVVSAERLVEENVRTLYQQQG
jgi:hypothetical protein